MRSKAVAMLMLAFSSHAKGEPVTFTAAASTKCGTFIGYASRGVDDTPMWAWAAGFLSGLNWFSWQAGAPDGAFSDFMPAMGWISDYCRKNPEDAFSAAVATYASTVISSKWMPATR